MLVQVKHNNGVMRLHELHTLPVIGQEIFTPDRVVVTAIARNPLGTLIHTRDIDHRELEVEVDVEVPDLSNIDLEKELA